MAFSTKSAAILVACRARKSLSENYCGALTGLMQLDDLHLMLQVPHEAELQADQEFL